VKHVFYVIYVLFYTGAVFVTGLFVGQMLERSWTARRRHAEGAESSTQGIARGTLDGRKEAAATGLKRN
jgi:NADH:ubiquinone oxidoreductase subunit 6 (subunit J)